MVFAEELDGASSVAPRRNTGGFHLPIIISRLKVGKVAAPRAAISIEVKIAAIIAPAIAL